MKKVLIIILAAVFIFGLKAYLTKVLREETQVASLPVASDESAEQPLNELLEVKFKENLYSVALEKVFEVDKLGLYLNLPEKRSSKDLFLEKKCRFLINAGFYGTDDVPIGWMVVDSEQMYPALKSDLLNGYFSASENGEALITSKKLESRVRWGVQSGPLLFQAGLPLPLQIKNDKPRRRSGVMLVNEGLLVFFSIFAKDSAFEGPYLEDLPDVLALVAERFGETIVAAINLDGGSASAFLTETVEVLEANPIGSYFCLQE